MEVIETISPDETAFAESDCLLPIEEYSIKWGISRRTADRYVKNGRVQVVKKAGRTLCIDTEPKPAIDKPDMADFSDNLSDCPSALPVRSDWIRFGIMTNQARQANTYKTLSVCLSIVLIGFVSVAVWWFVLQDRRAIAGTYDIRDLNASLARTEAALVSTESTLEQTEAALISAEKTIADESVRHASAVGGLVLKIEELTKTNIELSATTKTVLR